MQLTLTCSQHPDILIYDALVLVWGSGVLSPEQFCDDTLYQFGSIALVLPHGCKSTQQQHPPVMR